MSDMDGDGYDSIASGGDDCDDTNASVNPGVAVDTYGDLLDNDCNGIPDDGPFTYTDAADIQPLWDNNCATCHTTSAFGGLNLSPAYPQTVNVPSQDVPTMDLFEPLDPQNSYLWHKLNDTQGTVGGSGGVMPTSGLLPQPDLDMVETWILEGCPP